MPQASCSENKKLAKVNRYMLQQGSCTKAYFMDTIARNSKAHNSITVYQSKQTEV